MLGKSLRIILCNLNKIANLYIVCNFNLCGTILICAMTAKAKHTCMCYNLISVNQKCEGKTVCTIRTIKVLMYFLIITVCRVG